jgi:hypothetical protein
LKSLKRRMAMIEDLTVLPGKDKEGRKENFSP